MLSHLAGKRLGRPVHANDAVNMSQSSNDVIPTAIHVSAALVWRESLLPALTHLAATLKKKEAEVGAIVKTGRTHLMDAMPVTFGQELAAWRTQIEKGIERVTAVEARLLQLAQGGTAVGTGNQCASGFAARFARELSQATGHRLPAEYQPVRSHCHAGHRGGAFRPAEDHCRQPDEDRQRPALDEQRTAGGPRRDRTAGVAAGSSIMPGKVNP